MKILSLCCGAGGIDEGIKQAIGDNHERIFLDNWKDACETIKLNHDGEVIHGSILDHEESFNDVDVVVGGPPCPEFSIANSKRNFDDTLVKSFWRIVKNTNAKYWLMENVPDVIKVLPNQKNYLINCADYGTPQVRKRRFFTNLKFAIPTHAKNQQLDVFGNSIYTWITIEKALGIHSIIEDRKNTFEIYNKDYITNRTDIKYDTRKYFHDIYKPARTLTTKDIGPYPSMMIADTKHCRKLTNEECAILQGFPSDYKFHGGKVSVKRQIGNAVPPQPIKAFFEQLN